MRDVPVNAVHCKALTQHGKVTLGTMKVATGTRLFAQDAAVYVFTYDQQLARVRLTRVSREGGEPKIIASQVGLESPSHFRMTHEAAYYSRHGSVFRVGLGDGVVTEAAKGLAPAFAVHGDRIYGTTRRQPGATEQLVALKCVGGAPEPIVDIPADGGGVHRDYDYRNVSVDDKEAFISDWDARRILAISLADRTVRVLVKDAPFVLVRALEAEAVVYATASGLHRVSRSGGEPRLLNEIGKIPDAISFDADEAHFWIYQMGHMTDIFGIFRIPRAGGTATRFADIKAYSPTDPLHEDGFKDLAVDDECLYYARRANRETDTLSILAQPKNP